MFARFNGELVYPMTFEWANPETVLKFCTQVMSFNIM